MMKLQKRSHKIQKRVLSNEEQFADLKIQTNLRIDKIINKSNQQLYSRETGLQIEKIKQTIEEVYDDIKRIDRRSNEVIKQLKNHESSRRGFNQNDFHQRMDEKLDESYRKNKNYIDRAVGQLKNVIKEYVKDQAQLQKKITSSASEISRSNSKSRLSNVKSSQKSLKGSYTELNQCETSINDHSKCKSPQNSANNGNSRVNYLRQKLKQFEKINKKYEQNIDKKTPVQQKKVVQKMKDFKNYLQQSESEIQQSNLDIPENNILTDSLKKIKKQDRYHYNFKNDI